MSMCGPCKLGADKTSRNRERGGNLIWPHACANPGTCTCQHNRSRPAPAERGTDR